MISVISNHLVIPSAKTLLFWEGSKITADGDCSHKILKDTCSLE